MTASPPNPLLSSHQPSDMQVSLHPLVLLTISDYITRHTLRSQSGPIMGALLGQQNGRQITIEHAFECNTTSSADSPLGYTLDHAKFVARLEQCMFPLTGGDPSHSSGWNLLATANLNKTVRLVHKDRKLDLVGWYTLMTTDGPTPDILPTHCAMLAQNDACLLLGFHPDELAHHSVGAKLPLSIYESNYEADDDRDGEDQKMSGEDDTAAKIKFRELQYTVEAGDAEMISMDFVARGGGNATAIDQKDRTQKPEAADDKRGTKRRTAGAAGKEAASQDVGLSREEEEMISSLTAKANAIKMLQSRIQLIHAYLDQLPDSYKSGDYTPRPASESMTDAYATVAPPSTSVLRQTQALVSRLDLVVPSDEKAFHDELLREENDVRLVELLNGVLQSTVGAEGINRKAKIIDQARPRPKNGAYARDGRFRFGGEGNMVL